MISKGSQILAMNTMFNHLIINAIFIMKINIRAVQLSRFSDFVLSFVDVD